jgi:3-oxoadipate enol-lactonase
MPYIDVNGVELYVEIEGEGHPLLLIHGNGGNVSQMRKDREWLSRSFKTIAYDCRGHGRSEKPASYTLQDHIDDALALLDELGVSKAGVIGVSGGSYIAQGLAAAEPDRVTKLVLVVPRSHGAKSATQLFWERHAAETAGFSEAERMKFFMERVFSPAFVRRTDPRTLMELIRPEPALTPEETAAANRALERLDLRPALGRITAPTLVISGRMDGLNPPELGRETASLIPNAQFVEMPNSGHAPSFEEPEAFAELVGRFLKS